MRIEVDTFFGVQILDTPNLYLPLSSINFPFLHTVWISSFISYLEVVEDLFNC